MVVNSVCFICDNFEEARASVLVLVEVVGPYRVFVEGYMMMNIDWVGILKCY